METEPTSLRAGCDIPGRNTPPRRACHVISRPPSDVRGLQFLESGFPLSEPSARCPHCLRSGTVDRTLVRAAPLRVSPVALLVGPYQDLVRPSPSLPAPRTTPLRPGPVTHPTGPVTRPVAPAASSVPPLLDGAHPPGHTWSARSICRPVNSLHQCCRSAAPSVPVTAPPVHGHCSGCARHRARDAWSLHGTYDALRHP